MLDAYAAGQDGQARLTLLRSIEAAVIRLACERADDQLLARLPRPARCAASKTTIVTPPVVNGWCGACTRTNAERPSAVAGRAWRKYAAIAAPTSIGSGSRSARLPLPTITISPARQSITANPNRATSPARSPSLDNNNMIA